MTNRTTDQQIQPPAHAQSADPVASVESTTGAIQVDMKTVMDLPLDEMRAVLHLSMDKIMAQAAVNPLVGLSSLLGYIHGAQAEVLKAKLMRVMTTTRDGALTDIAVNHDNCGVGEITSAQSRTLDATMRLGEHMAKIGAARVKVDDEIRRRERRRRP